MKAGRRVFILVLLVAVAAFFAYRSASTRARPTPGTLTVYGTIEVTDVPLSFRLPGWIEQKAVVEGMAVTNGQEVARLDRTELRQEVEVRSQEVAVARAQLAELEAGSRPEELAAARAVVARTETEVRLRTTERDRARTLLDTAALSQQDFDTAQAAYDTALARLEEARAQGKLLEEGPRRERIDQARARFHQAEAALAIARTRLEYAVLCSPLTGTVLSEGAEQGEFVAAGTPVVTVADLSDVWLRAYVREEDLGRVRLGQRALVRIDSFPLQPYEGEVSFLAAEAEFTPRNVQTEKERVKLVYRIKIRLANPAQELKPGMPADAQILAGP